VQLPILMSLTCCLRHIRRGAERERSREDCGDWRYRRSILTDRSYIICVAPGRNGTREIARSLTLYDRGKRPPCEQRDMMTAAAIISRRMVAIEFGILAFKPQWRPRGCRGERFRSDYFDTKRPANKCLDLGFLEGTALRSALLRASRRMAGTAWPTPTTPWSQAAHPPPAPRTSPT
jgi:hypothetical protein